MRKEANLEEWKVLYEVATRIQALEPWKTLWDMDLIGVLVGDKPEETVFYSVMGKNNECYAIAVYEGYEAFNSFMLLLMHEDMNISFDYAIYNQHNLTCYWGNREELSKEQCKIIKDLGYQYRGKNNWMYFMSNEPGYQPYNLDKEEVLRMTEHLQNLEIAFTYYKENDIPVDFDNGKMFLAIFSKDKKEREYREWRLPFDYYIFEGIEISDEELINDLKKAPKSNMVLEADAGPMGVAVADKKYKKPAIPTAGILADANTGMILKCDMNEPDEDPMLNLLYALIDFIYTLGAPKEVRVSNPIVEAILGSVCELCGIKLKFVKKLKTIDDFIFNLKGM